MSSSESDSDAGGKGVGSGSSNGTGADPGSQGCSDMESVMSMSVKQLQERLSRTLCKSPTGRVGFAFLGAFMDSLDVNNNGEIGGFSGVMLQLCPSVCNADEPDT